MIKIVLERNPDGFIRRFSAAGHSGYADQGSDIICAAISALAQTTIGSLQELASIDPARQLADGLIDFSLPDPAALDPVQRHTAEILMASLVIGCRQIQNSYPGRYVRFSQTSNKGGAKA
jgi:hypothetical protein